MSTAEILTAYECCDRKGFWSRDWQRRRLTPNEMLRRALTAGVTESERSDFGEVAGETIMELGVDPGMETPSSHNIYDSVVHHAALADILTQAIRRPGARPWSIPPPTTLGGAPWASGAFVDPLGTTLRQIVLASSWSDSRHYAEVRNWRTTGEVAAYRLPMQVAVLILGQYRDGRRSGPWTKGFLHPRNRMLRFRKRARISSEVFSEKWEQVWREDRGEIATGDWLQSMLGDDILRDVCFTVDIPELDTERRARLEDITLRKLERLAKLSKLPEASVSVCDRPPCPYKGCCWSTPQYLPSQDSGFVRIGVGQLAL